MNPAPTFAALGDEIRLSLIQKLIQHGPTALGKLAQGEQVTRQAVTKHLAVLQSAGLARVTQRGRERVWEVQPEKLEEASQYLNRISREWDRALQRLKQFVE
jgi:DNA-binding transcriptional ArsR family regulator